MAFRTTFKEFDSETQASAESLARTSLDTLEDEAEQIVQLDPAIGYPRLRVFSREVKRTRGYIESIEFEIIRESLLEGLVAIEISLIEYGEDFVVPYVIQQLDALIEEMSCIVTTVSAEKKIPVAVYSSVIEFYTPLLRNDLISDELKERVKVRINEANDLLEKLTKEEATGFITSRNLTGGISTCQREFNLPKRN